MTLITPKVIVTLEQPGTDAYKEITVQTDNRDAVRWDMLRSRKKWPAGSDAPMLWMTVLAWSALKRSDEIDGEFEAFNDKCVQVRSADKDGQPKPLEELEEDEIGADPTRPARVTGS